MNLQQADPVVYYDGVCLLCSRTIQFLLKADKNEVLQFAPQQGERFRLLQSQQPGIPQESIIFIKNGRVYARSNAVLAIAKELPYPWKLFYTAVIIPRFIRDAAYMIIARNRKHWFGESAACYTGDEKNRKRFLP